MTCTISWKSRKSEEEQDDDEGCELLHLASRNIMTSTFKSSFGREQVRVTLPRLLSL